jgi:hypothetical protein
MPREGSRILSDVRAPTLTIVCEPCERRGRYNVEGPFSALGGAKLTNLLATLADCPKARSVSIHGGARRSTGSGAVGEAESESND